MESIFGQRDWLQPDHTVTTGLHGSVIILGRDIHPEGQTHNHVITVRLQPKSLQQVAMEVIHHHRKVNSAFSGMLPTKLARKILGTE